MQHGGVVVAERLHVHAVGKLTCAGGLLQAGDDRLGALAAVFGQPVHHRLVLRCGTGGRRHHQAALRAPALGVGEHGVVQHAFDGRAHRLFAQRAVGEAPVAGFVQRHRLAEQLLLAAEGRIDTRRGDAQRLHQRRHRRAFVATRPEQQHGLLEGVVFVEFAGAAGHGASLRKEAVRQF